MPSDKWNSITAKAMDLICALFDIVLYQNVPFWKLQQLKHLHHGSTKARLSPLYSIPFSTATQVTIYGMRIITLVIDSRETLAYPRMPINREPLYPKILSIPRYPQDV